MWSFFFCNDTAGTEIYTLSLHDALPIWPDTDVRAACDALGSSVEVIRLVNAFVNAVNAGGDSTGKERRDRKSTRLNSSHANVSYAVFRLKKKTRRTRRTLFACTSTQRAY